MCLYNTCGVALKVHGNVCLVTSVGLRQIGLLFEHIPSTNFPAEEGFVANSLICAQKIQPEIKQLEGPKNLTHLSREFRAQDFFAFTSKATIRQCLK